MWWAEYPNSYKPISDSAVDATAASSEAVAKLDADDALPANDE